MDARVTWNLWRKILSEPTFADAVLAGKLSDLALSPEEVQICASYAGTPGATRWFIANYRFRLVSSIGYALETGAPLTWRLLRAHDVEPRALATAFLDETGWVDRGPYVYTTCRLVLDFVRRTYAARVPFVADLAGLETVAAILLCSLAGGSSGSGPAERQSEPHEPCLARSRAVAIASTAHDLRSWLRDAGLIGKTVLAPTPLHILVRLPSASTQVRYVSIGATGRRVLDALDRPRTRKDLIKAVAFGTAADASIHAVIDRLIEVGAVVPEPP